MELGLMVEPQVGGSYDRLKEIAMWAESLGIDAFARSDHYLDHERSAPATDALTSFGGLAEVTDSIRLVVLVTPLTFRHPAVIAKTAATLDEMTGGRFALGIGTGWMQSEHRALGIDLPPLRERFERLGEALAYVRAVFGEGGGFAGEHYQLDPVAVLPRPVNVPIIVGGSGMNKTPALAGRFADEYNMLVTDRDTVAQRLAVMRTAAIESGRDPDEVLISFVGPAVVAETDGEYRSLLAERGAQRDMSAAEYETFLAEQNVPRGTPDRVSTIMSNLASMGIGRFYLQLFTALDDIDETELTPVFTALRG